MTLETIKQNTEKYFNISLSERTRKGNYILARTFYFKTAYKLAYPKYSLQMIGKSINRDHATVLHHTSKHLTPKEQQQFNEFLSIIENNKASIVEIKNKSLLKEIKQQEAILSDLKAEKEFLTLIPTQLLKKLSQLNETQLKNVLERFLLIADMELRKKY